jgi:hypothetical protein
MSAGELWTRIQYDAYCRLERARHARGALAQGGRLRKALVPALGRSNDWRAALVTARQRRTTRFFAGTEQREQTRALFLERYPAELERARVEADRALRHEFSFFGGTYRFDDRIDWHADPVTGAHWPKVYHRDVPVHGGDVGFGDVKHVWELARHQFLIDLARAWAIDGEPRYAAAARALVLDWRAENPVGTGVAWSCALEPAFRVLSWLWAYNLTLDDPAFDTDGHVQWLEGFHEHGWFLYRHLEYYTSPFNHLAGEACALYCLGVLFPEFTEAQLWRAHARHLLESRLPMQFYPDGGSVEQSTFYHHATTGFYLVAALLGRVNGEEFSTGVWRAIERGIEFSALMQQPDGTTPHIGGADDGKPIRLEQLPLWDFRPYQTIGAVLFGRPDFKAAAGRFFEDALWLLGLEGAARFDALDTAPPSPPSRALESSGYVVIRNNWAADADYLCFDCGEQAAGLRRDAIPSAAHGHADCLSIVVWRRGQPVLVDAGFYCYNGPKPWQDHFRETAAHNTVRIDGRDQALHINKMAWSQTYTARLEGQDLKGPSYWAIASHDGYRALPRGSVTHRRAVWVRERGYIVVCDFLDGTSSHDIELTYQFAPGNLLVTGTRVSFDERVDLYWFAPIELSACVQEGGALPDTGWIAPSLGVKAAAPRLVLAGNVALPASIVTVFADTIPERLGVSCSPTSGPSPIVISGCDWADWLVVQGLGDGSAYALETDALVGAWTYHNGRLAADGRIGGTFQSSGD